MTPEQIAADPNVKNWCINCEHHRSQHDHDNGYGYICLGMMYVDEKPVNCGCEHFEEGS